MERVQNLAAKVVLGKSKRDSRTICLSALHWLPIWSRINHKILTLIHKCIMGKAPEYLQNLLAVHKPGRLGLRSALDTNFLVVPFATCKTFPKCPFSIQGPKLWNSLPDDLRSERDTDIFKRKLKTHLQVDTSHSVWIICSSVFLRNRIDFYVGRQAFASYQTWLPQV